MNQLYTLLLRLQGPMQSWGSSSRFSERDTAMEPSKSGIIGLLCAALGKPRLEEQNHSGLPSLHSLRTLRMGVLILSPGKVGVDFQSAGGGNLGGRSYGVVKADPSKRAETVLSWRYFLQDADFLVALQGNVDLLTKLHNSLASPVWQLCLGRKSYVPSTPPYIPDGLKPGTLHENFTAYISTLPPEIRRPRYRVVIDDDQGGEQRLDVPLDFENRIFGLRHVSTHFIQAQGVS